MSSIRSNTKQQNFLAKSFDSGVDLKVKKVIFLADVRASAALKRQEEAKLNEATSKPKSVRKILFLKDIRAARAARLANEVQKPVHSPSLANCVSYAAILAQATPPVELVANPKSQPTDITKSTIAVAEKLSEKKVSNESNSENFIENQDGNSPTNTSAINASAGKKTLRLSEIRAARAARLATAVQLDSSDKSAKNEESKQETACSLVHENIPTASSPTDVSPMVPAPTEKPIGEFKDQSAASGTDPEEHSEPLSLAKDNIASASTIPEATIPCAAAVAAKAKNVDFQEEPLVPASELESLEDTCASDSCRTPSLPEAAIPFEAKTVAQTKKGHAQEESLGPATALDVNTDTNNPNNCSASPFPLNVIPTEAPEDQVPKR